MSFVYLSLTLLFIIINSLLVQGFVHQGEGGLQISTTHKPNGLKEKRRIKSARTLCSSLNSNSSAENFKNNVFLFPGQGAQFIGMCENSTQSSSIDQIFSLANEILGYDIKQISNEGPKELLDSTEIAQPAIFVASMVAVEKFKELKGLEQINGENVALGLSLGEYSALCFAKSIEFHYALKLVKERGRAMQAASDSSEGSMVAILGLNATRVQEMCEYIKERINEPIFLANYLSPGNYVISGSKKACEYAQKIARSEFKALKAVRLSVAGAFHTDFMLPAATSLMKMLDNTPIYPPQIPIISNVDAKAHSDPAQIKINLYRQLTQPVKWEESLNSIIKCGFQFGYELGPGNVLSGLIKRMDKTCNIQSIG